MGDGFAEIDAMIAAVKRVGVLASTVASRAVPEVARVLKASAAAGTSPDGQAWAPKKDGGRALEHAPDAIDVKASGSVITSRLVGTSSGSAKVQAIQNYGAKNLPARPMLPSAGGGIPDPIRAVLREVSKKAFDEAVKA